MTAASISQPSVNVERWPTEIPLFVLCVIASLFLWLALIVSVIGIIYALAFLAFFFVAHVMLVSAVRGNGVRLGPDQFPELHARVEQLARAFGMDPVPEAYLIQAGGALNAFATRFLRSNMIVLFSDLLDACQGDARARDMIIAHELGHLAAGHLKFLWFTLPAAMIPFLGTALSRAREYTCDRYGAAGAGDRNSAVLGLTVLAAGGKLAPQVNRTAFARQRGQLDTGWMTIGEWLSTHPPLCKRIAAIDRTLVAEQGGWKWGAPRALGIIAAIMTVLVGGGVLGGRFVVPLLRQAAEQAQPRSSPGEAAANDNRAIVAQGDLERLAALVDREIATRRTPPADYEELMTIWRSRYQLPGPVDPFDGEPYGYEVTGVSYRLWSSGPDGRAGTGDDIVVRSAPRSRGL